MKNMNRIELKDFVKKYFEVYNNDIRKVSYIVYENRVEYLINDSYLFII